MNKDNWKWWYFVVAGLLIGAYGGYELYSGLIRKGVGSEILAVLCIAIGLFSRKAETKPTPSATETESEPEGPQ